MSWVVKPLGTLSKIMYGYTESASIEEVGPRFLRITDIQENGVEWSSVPYCKIAADELKKYRLASGDIVFARTGATTGKSFLVADPPESVFASYLIRVQINQPSVLPEYLNLYFQTPQYWDKISEGVTGSAQGGFNATKLGELNIPIPPLPEQQRIVAKLDAAFAALTEAQAHVERNRANARELFESYLNGVFEGKGDGWVEKRLGDVATQISTGPFGTMLHKADYVKDGIPLVNPMNIVNSRIVPSDRMMVNHKTRDRLSSYVLKKGDVVIARRGELGRCALVTDTEDGWMCGTGSFFMRLSKEVDPEFFVLVFGSHLFKEKLQELSVGTTMSSLNITILEGLELPLPPIKEQRALLDRFSALRGSLDELETTYHQKLSELAGLKKAVLGAAFRGEL